MLVVICDGVPSMGRDWCGDLHRAVEERWGEATEVIGLLLVAGADVNARDANRETALSRALDRNKTHIVEVLRKAGARE